MKQQLTYDEISALCMELSMFLHAGLPCGSGLALLAQDSPPALSEALSRMGRQVDEGEPLSAAFAHSGLFPRELWTMLQVGEQTGRSEETLASLSRYYDWLGQIDGHIRSALLYPSLLLLIMAAVILVLLTRVLPIFEQVYAGLGGALSGVAGWLLRLGTALDGILPLLCLLLGAAAVALILFSCSAAFRQKAASLWQRLRGEGTIAKKLTTARFAQALTMALSSGETAEEAAATAGRLMTGEEGRARCDACLADIRAGRDMAEAIREAGLLPAAECRLLQLGLVSGRGAEAAAEVARRLSRSAEESVTRAIEGVEPAMVAVTALLVGAILLSVMLPLMRIMSAIG